MAEDDVDLYYHKFPENVKNHNADLVKRLRWQMHTSTDFIKTMKNGSPVVLQGAAHVDLKTLCDYIDLAIQKALCWYTERVALPNAEHKLDSLILFPADPEYDSFILNEAIQHWNMEGEKDVGFYAFLDFEDREPFPTPRSLVEVTTDLVDKLSFVGTFRDLLPPEVEFNKYNLLLAYKDNEDFLLQKIIDTITNANESRMYIQHLVKKRPTYEFPPNPAPSLDDYNGTFDWLRKRNLDDDLYDELQLDTMIFSKDHYYVLETDPVSILRPTEDKNWIKVIPDFMKIKPNSDMNIVLECVYRDISGMDENAWLFVMMKPFKDRTHLRRDWRKRLWDIHGTIMKALYEKNPAYCEAYPVIIMTAAWRVVAWRMTEIDMNWIDETFYDVDVFLDKVTADLNDTIERIIQVMSL